MASKFESDFLDVEISDYKFSSDEDKNLKMMNNYKQDIVNFFKTHELVNHKVLTEREVWIEVDNNVFIGYIDAMHKEGDTYIITDYKTSSISEFQGSKLLEKQKQLLLYAYGIHQLGIPLDKIKIRWNFLKYTNILVKHMINVTYNTIDKEGNIKPKTSCVKKCEWVSKIKTQLKKDIKEFNNNLSAKELKDMIDKCVEDNSLESLDKSIQDKYVLSDVVKIGNRHNWTSTKTLLTQIRKDLKETDIEPIEMETLIIDCINSNSLEPLKDWINIENYVLKDAYIYGIVNSDNIDNLISEMTEDIKQITQRGVEECNWEIVDKEPIGKDKQFYCNVLCGYKEHCKYYTDYINKLKEEQGEYISDNDDSILKELLQL